MMGTRNPNHKNKFGDVKESKVEVKKEKPKKEEPKITLEMVYGLNKKEQVSMLKDLSISGSEIKKLKTEKDRVEKILGILKEMEE